MSEAPDLILQYKEDGKLKRNVRVQAKSDLFLIGSSKTANLRLKGKNISGCHLVLKYRAPHWYACDLSSSEETLLDSKKIVEEKLQGSHTITIGGHEISLVNYSRPKGLFAEPQLDSQGSLDKQQIVVRKGWKIVETIIADRNESVELLDGGVKVKLAPPTGSDWVVTDLGRRVVQQRLVPAQEILTIEKYKVDEDLLKPLAIVIMIFIALTIGVKLAPTSTTTATLDNKSMDMIFNAKAIMKKRVESKKMQMAAKHGGTAAASEQTMAQSSPDQSQAPKISNKTTVALNNIRMSGLNSLIGKIAKRAAKSGIMIAASGAEPDKAPGRAFYSGGTATVGGGGSAAKAGTTFKLGGIGTKGVGGGASNVGQGTALTGGSVGQGDVALIDDETVIDGGLDKDQIAEVIRKNLGQVRECYERQLSANRDLYGKVQVKFSINAQGLVNEPRIENSTMKSSMVEGCMLRRLAGWKFPLPRGGTIVKVSYPFLFKALD